MFLSEVKAQQARRSPAPAVSTRVADGRFTGCWAAGFHDPARPSPTRLRIVHPSVPPGCRRPAAVSRELPTIVPQAFIAKMQEWLVTAFSEFVKTQSQKFLAAAEDPADGVTLGVHDRASAGAQGDRQVLAEKGTSSAQIAETIAKGGRPAVRVEALPGHKCD